MSNVMLPAIHWATSISLLIRHYNTTLSCVERLLGECRKHL
jgi:hypothetical protein